MLILLTGATGFVGHHLMDELVARGHKIRVLAREIRVLPPTIQSVTWALGDKLMPECLRDVDAIIHLAHDFSGVDGTQRTIEGTRHLFQQAHGAGVQRQILVSSYSAGPHAKSSYGRSKYILEQVFHENNGLIVRPGLVLGNGGIFGRIRKVSQHWSVIPLPDGGCGLVPVIAIELLVKRLADLVAAANPPFENNLFEPELVSLRTLVWRAASEVGRRPWILPVPAKLVMTGLWLAESLHLKLPVNCDNLSGFLANQSAGHTSSLGSNLEFIQ